MQNSRLASRYAKALLDLAVEQNALDTTLNDVQLLVAVGNQSRDFVNVLQSPIIKSDKKQSIIDAVVGAQLNDLAKAFVKLLINKGREATLLDMAASFIEQYKEMKNIKTVRLTTAVPATDAVRAVVREKLALSHPNATIELEETVNEDIIGGLIIQMDDKMFDFSIRRDLNDVKDQFSKNLYISEMR
ncbi:MAG: ATP synthase F1 subunit delta [Flavipsychrobacter sp.]